MAHWNPHLLSTKLCRVLDAELTTVDEIAKVAELPPRFIEQVAKGGVKLNRDTELQISKAIGPLFHAHPELYKDPERAPKRGVFEVELRHRGWRGFEIKNSAGKCVMYVEWPKEEASQSRIDGLWRWLDREDPAPQLRVI